MKYLIITCLTFIIFGCTVPETANETTFQDFIDNFDPSEARSSNELNAQTFEAEVQWLEGKLIELHSFDTSQLLLDDKIDWLFAQSILKGRLNRQTLHQSWKKDPRTYMQFRSLGNIIGGPGEQDEKLARLEESLKLIPVQLANGENQLEYFVPRFQELSLYMAKNSKDLFEKEIPAYLEDNSSDMSGIDKAQVALASYIDFLENDLPNKPQIDFAMGTEAYNLMLSEEVLLDYTDETLWAFGKKRFAETVEELEILANEIDPQKTWQELAIEIKNDYPGPHEMIEAHQLWVDSSKSHILSKKLIPIPWEEQVLVVPRAEYLRKTSYYGNFSRARGKDENNIFTAQWMINPYEDRWDQQTKDEYLVEHDWGVIIVTAPHEAYGGHHVQSLYQIHNPRKIRKENGLSLFSEGWGLYNEQLMSETGFFPDNRIHLRQLQLRLWRNARVIYDVGMHTGKMTYEEAISLMTDQVGFLRWAAQLEVDAAAARPGYFIGYFMGMTEILKMREEYKLKTGEEFTLSDFHEKLLKVGNMPPKLMARGLLEEE